MDLKGFEKINYTWVKYSLLVVYDKFMGDGLRVHLVSDKINPSMLDNALVLNIVDWEVATSLEAILKDI